MNEPVRHGAVRARLDELTVTQQRRSVESRGSAAGPRIEIDARHYDNFASNDYLGLASDADVCRALQDGATRWGVGAGAAALLSGRTQAHAELEVALARAMGRERALLFSSGYLANLGVLGALIGRHHRVYHDRLNHASLIDGVRLSGARHKRYAHCDATHLQRLVAADPRRPAWLVTETLFSMDGDLAPLKAFAALCQRYELTMMCDDAHGFGVLGEGRGAVCAAGVGARECPLVVVTFGKALGTLGAAVVGDGELIEYLINTARTFIYDTALPPAIAHATTVALCKALDPGGPRTQLLRNIQRFRTAAAKHGLPLSVGESAIQPLLVGDTVRALAIAARLRNAGVYARAIRPPTVPSGTARIRLCMSAAHTGAQIERLCGAMATALATESSR